MNLRLMLAALGIASLLAAGLGLYWKGRLEGSAAERPKVAAAVDQAAVARLEAAGARSSAARVAVVVRQREAAAETVTRITPEILNTESAHAPLDTDRGARLRRHDRELCELASDRLSGCAPTSRDARGGGQPLRALPVAAEPH